MSKNIERLVVLGPPGSYLDGLAASMDLGYPIEYGENFPDMIAQAETSPGTAILLPIKNTLDGTINQVVGAFQSGKLMVDRAAKLDVVSNVMGLGSLEEARSIAGKDVALGQITSFMPHLERIVMSSTSAAGKQIQETGDKAMLSVGARAQARLYGLNVLAEAAQDKVGLNRTTVLMTRGRNSWQFDPDTIDRDSDRNGVMILGVEYSDRAGSLYRALGEIADRDINLTNIESLNIRGTEDNEFFITLSGSSAAIVDLITSRQAARHLTLDVLGVFEEPKIYSS